MYEIIINKYNKYKKQYETDQQTIKSFDKFYRESLRENLIESESLCNNFSKYVDGKKNEFFYKYEHRDKIEII